MTHPQKLSELLELTTASRHIAEHNTREVARVGAYREFSDDDGTARIVGDEMAAKLLPSRKLSKWDKEVAERREALLKHNAEVEANYRKAMRGG